MMKDYLLDKNTLILYGNLGLIVYVNNAGVVHQGILSCFNGDTPVWYKEGIK